MDRTYILLMIIVAITVSTVVLHQEPPETDKTQPPETEKTHFGVTPEVTPDIVNISTGSTIDSDLVLTDTAGFQKINYTLNGEKKNRIEGDYEKLPDRRAEYTIRDRWVSNGYYLSEASRLSGKGMTKGVVILFPNELLGRPINTSQLGRSLIIRAANVQRYKTGQEGFKPCKFLTATVYLNYKRLGTLTVNKNETYQDFRFEIPDKFNLSSSYNTIHVKSNRNRRCLSHFRPIGIDEFRIESN